MKKNEKPEIIGCEFLKYLKKSKTNIEKLNLDNMIESDYLNSL